MTPTELHCAAEDGCDGSCHERLDDFTLNGYQAEAMRTSSDLATGDTGVIIAALGLAGEAGEFADHVKKFVAQGHALDRDKLDREVGDVLWYIARYAEWRGVSLGRLAQLNLEKLAARYGGMFSAEKSQARVAGDT